MSRLLLFVLPLSLDTFAMSATLGIGGLAQSGRLKISLVFSGFEMAMPVLGLLVGRGLGQAIGGIAEYVAAAALLSLGSYILLAGGEGEKERFASLQGTRSSIALIGLGISVSLDEMAMGFAIGLLRLPILGAIALIGIQAFVVAQLGLRLGSRLGELVREGAERLAGLALIGLGILILVEKLT
jgi:putative Mn2+ efflux pump MntP